MILLAFLIEILGNFWRWFPTSIEAKWHIQLTGRYAKKSSVTFGEFSDKLIYSAVNTLIGFLEIGFFFYTIHLTFFLFLSCYVLSIILFLYHKLMLTFYCFDWFLLKSVATEMKHRYHLYGTEDESEAQRKVKQSKHCD